MDLRNRLLALVVAAFCATSANALPLYQDVSPGEYWAINFQFSAVPFESTGGADVFIANGGSSARGLLSSIVSIFRDGVLLASYDNASMATLGVFRTPESPYRLFGVAADLDGIFHGGAGRLELKPVFDPTVADAFVNYQLTQFEAKQSSGIVSFLDAAVAPTISSTALLSVPEPASPLLVATAMLLMIATRSRVGTARTASRLAFAIRI